MRQFVLNVAAALLLSQPAHAAITGHDLRKSCDSDQEVAQGFCLGFVEGIADGLDTMSFCIPLDVTVNQKRATVQQYLREHPELTDRQASHLVVETFKKAYPCD